MTARPRISAQANTGSLKYHYYAALAVATGHDWCAVNRCAGLAAPPHGSLGDCPSVLEHGASCALRCDPGYTLGGTQPSCRFGSYKAGLARGGPVIKCCYSSRERAQ